MRMNNIWKKYSKKDLEDMRETTLSFEEHLKKNYIEHVLEILIQETIPFPKTERKLYYVKKTNAEEYIYIRLYNNYEQKYYYHRICITADSNYSILIDFVRALQEIWG